MHALIIGAGIGGLCSALAFRQHNWDVMVLDADDSPRPTEHDRDSLWRRPGTPHSLQAHCFSSGFVRTLGNLSPVALDRILSSGVVDQQVRELKPPKSQAPDDLDPQIHTLGARRPHVEAHLFNAVAEDSAIDWRFGSHVRGLTATSASPPQVTGVVTSDGETSKADVVIDCSGRRSKAAKWLADVGAKLPEPHSETCDMTYRSRHYRYLDPTDHIPTGGGVAIPFALPTFQSLLFPGDNATFMMVVGSVQNDPLLERANEPAVFETVCKLNPHFARALDPDRSEATSEVVTYGGMRNHLQRLVVDGEPAVTGFHFVGDSGATTNPTFGRGASHAAVHAEAVAGIVTTADDPAAAAIAVNAEVSRMIAPSVEQSSLSDRARSKAARIMMTGRRAKFEAPPLPEGITQAQLSQAWIADPQVWRTLFREGQVMEPLNAWMRNEDILKRVRSQPVADKPPRDFDPAIILKGIQDAIAAV